MVNTSEPYGSYRPENAVDGIAENADLINSFCSKVVSCMNTLYLD